LDVLRRMMVERVEVTTTSTVQQTSEKKTRASPGLLRKMRGRKKVKDSGIGMEDDEDETMLAA
jgi:myosin protein heavy chain